MINQLRKKLIFIYTCSTGIILAIVLMMALAITNQQLLQNRKENFQNNFMTVTQKLLINNEISHFWLAEMEMKNRLILSIEDNGEPFIYKGAWKPATERDQLVEMVKTLALKDKINTDIRPASVSEVQSKIYELKGKQGDRYFGAVFLVAAQKGYRSVVMLQYRSENYAAALRQKILMIALYLSGITALYFVSRWIVGKSLRPIEESRRSQTQFIASASHELKSPLAVISANASAMLVDQDRTEHYTQGIQKECRRLSSLIEDLLLLAATDAGKWNLKKELIDMDLLLIETFEAFQPFCIENHKKLQLELQEEMFPKIEGDSLRMKQILSVLLDNAVTYSKDYDEIILRAFTKKNQLLIEVEDHGMGIAEDKKKEIFDRFYKGDKSRKDKSHFGLGLSIAKELTELHGGRITLRDTPGGGTTFIVNLPAVKNREL